MMSYTMEQTAFRGAFRGHSFNTYEKLFKKTNFSYPLIRILTCAYQAAKAVIFSENLAYLLNKWSLRIFLAIANHFTAWKVSDFFSFIFPQIQTEYRLDKLRIWTLFTQWKLITIFSAQKTKFPFSISSVNVTKSAVSCGFG